jgi:putative toxin-antitoxin system antitoxin component (TIGR02293 family)
MGGERVIGRPVRSLGELRQLVEEGLPKQAVREVTRWVHREPREQRRLRLAIVPDATFKRRRERLSTAESEKLERIARVAAAADRVWGNQEDARQFLTSPHPLLGGETPLEAAATDIGARQVEDILAAIEYGLPV